MADHDGSIDVAFGTWVDSPYGIKVGVLDDAFGTWVDSPGSRVTAALNDTFGTWADSPSASTGTIPATLNDTFGVWVDAPRHILPATLTDVFGTWADSPTGNASALNAALTDIFGTWADSPAIAVTYDGSLTDVFGTWVDAPDGRAIAALDDAFGTWADSPQGTLRISAALTDIFGTWADSPDARLLATLTDVFGAWTDAPVVVPAGLTAALNDVFGGWADAPRYVFVPGLAQTYGTPYATGFLINTETGAMTTADWPATGLGLINGQLLAVGDAGLLALDAADDAGSDIVWRLRTGRPGQQQLSRVDSVMLYLEGGENVILKTLADGRDGLIEDWYAVTRYGTNADVQAHAKPGKGRKGIRWGVEVAGRNDARLTRIDPYYHDLSRRR